MGRPPKFTEDELLDAVVGLLVEHGPTGLSVAAAARRVGAPSGSVYHRFPSRDHLAASAWLRAAERFQDEWATRVKLEDADAVAAVRASAAYTVAFARDHPGEAEVLLMYRSADLVGGEWPADLVDRNERQRARAEAAVGGIAERLGVASDAEFRRLRFALFGVPTAAIREALAAGTPPTADVERLVDDAVVALLRPFS